MPQKHLPSHKISITKCYHIVFHEIIMKYVIKNLFISLEDVISMP